MKKTNDDALEMLKQASEIKRDEIMEAGRAAADQVKYAATAVNDSVHKKPWYYLGGAAFIGFLAGIFSRSKRHSR